MLTWCSSAVNLSFPSFLAVSRTRSSPFGPLSRLGVRCELGSDVFSLVSGLPSTASAVGCPPLFGCFVGNYAAVRLPPVVQGGLMAHRLLLPARSLPAGDCGVSRFSRMEFLCMLGVFDSAGPRLARDIASARCCLPCGPTPSAPRNTRFRSSIPSLQLPLSNASSAASLPPSHGSGPGWLAMPSLYDSFIRYSMPVHPGAIRTRRVHPHSRPVRSAVNGGWNPRGDCASPKRASPAGPIARTRNASETRNRWTPAFACLSRLSHGATPATARQSMAEKRQHARPRRPARVPRHVNAG